MRLPLSNVSVNIVSYSPSAFLINSFKPAILFSRSGCHTSNQNSSFLISASNMNTDVEKLIFGFEDILSKDVNIFGGMAGDDLAFKEQFVFTNGKSSSNGMVALLLDEEKILIKGIATHGWMAVGTEKTVTKSEGNQVFDRISDSRKRRQKSP